jgi:hypothetical protein
MRNIIHDEASNNFIEGPMPFRPENDGLQETASEKAAYHADIPQGYELEGDDNDKDVRYYDANERYD